MSACLHVTPIAMVAAYVVIGAVCIAVVEAVAQLDWGEYGWMSFGQSPFSLLVGVLWPVMAPMTLAVAGGQAAGRRAVARREAQTRKAAQLARAEADADLVIGGL